MSERIYTLSELDYLHASVGLGPEWMGSDRRAEVAAERTIEGEVVSVVHGDAPQKATDTRG